MILTINGRQQAVYQLTDPLTRAVVISLFTWRKAGKDDVPEEVNGWWGDTFPTVQNDRIGSRLYLLKRSKLTNQTPLKAREYIAEALQWLTADGVAARVDVTAQRLGINSMSASTVIRKQDGTTLTLSFDDLWSELNG
ncbi:phage GP46 family protein [Pantoea sp. SORGH_AS_0659]|uniref:phage GP46 family protein n=1 Tax=Pantoea sp. SORGH_AS_0659 TaxID=3062597 RepID=UPI00285575C5|nr:phage GP46 family protein [Pantoea sp. SORGH_AS_0659]MDR6350827.1 phage gp46-like protein [Pantoea sp. SORGH_AS_0659]